MVSAVAGRAVPVPPAVVARQNRVEGIEEVAVRARAQLHDHEAGRGMGDENVQQPVALALHEPSTVPGQVGEAGVRAGADRQLRGLQRQFLLAG